MPNPDQNTGQEALTTLAALRLAGQAAANDQAELELYRRIIEQSPESSTYDNAGAMTLVDLVSGSDPEFRVQLT